MTLHDLGGHAIDAVVSRVRAQIERSLGFRSPADIESLLRVVQERLTELATDSGWSSDSQVATDAISLSVHVDLDAVAVEILAGPARDWIQLS